MHLSNLANGGQKDDSLIQDADSLFKYYEEKYECIAFEGDDFNVAVADQSGTVLDSRSASHIGAQSEFFPDECKNEQTLEEMDSGILLHNERPSSPIRNRPLSDDEEEMEEAPRRERFDRTKISR